MFNPFRCKVLPKIVHQSGFWIAKREKSPQNTFKMFLSPLISIIFLTLLQNFCAVHSANILFYAAIGSHSTRISKWPLMEALAEKGHTVTYLSAFKNFEMDPKSKIKTYEPKKWTDSMGPWESHSKFYDVRKTGKGSHLWYDLLDLGKQSCDVLYSDPEFVKWIKSNKFDLVIVESVVNECAYGMIHLWQAKFAIYGTTTVIPWMPDAYGLPDESSSITDIILCFTSEDKSTFFERFANAMNPIYFALMREYNYLPSLEQITRKGLGEEVTKNMPSFKEIEKNNSLIFLSTHYSMDYPRSFPPNVIPVGGNVVAGKVKPLPADMGNFISSSKSGFIYISFGTVTEFTNFDEGVQIEFINALAQFPEINFVWKSSEKINVTTLPKNVFMAKWAPQQTILAHPKIKAYITHSGMGSIMEAIHFSVPLVCIPVLAEQDYNTNLMVRRGVCPKVEIVDMKQHELEDAIREVLHNKKYRQAMSTLTKVFKDRQTPPLENAVWWIEYILRHDNINEFIVPPNVHQPWWKRRQIDVWLTAGLCLLTIVTVPLCLLYFSIKKLLCFLLGRGNAVELKGKKKN